MSQPHDGTRRRSALIAWSAAVVLTLGSAAWQRVSGPTYPVTVDVTVGDARVQARLLRTHSIDRDQPVDVRTSSPDVEGVVRWRRFPTADAWQTVALERRGDTLVASLPRQPAAGKLEYQIVATQGGASVSVPDRPVVTRFKGNVSAALLVPHIACMFLGLLFSARAGFGAFTGARSSPWVGLALVLWVVGGLVLGPGVQKQAFDAYWTGVPFGIDLTDNKTLIAVVAWAWAAWRGRGMRHDRVAIVVAMLLTFVVFAIPHSTWGSQVNWTADGRRAP